MELPLKMRQDYLARRRSDLDTLRSENPPFKTLGHQIKGNARSYGFEALEGIARRMEVLNENSSKAVVNSLVSEFENWLVSEENNLGSSTQSLESSI